MYRFIDDLEEALKLGLADKYTRNVHIHTLNARPLLGTTTVKGIVGDKSHLLQWYSDVAAAEACGITEEYQAVQAILDKEEKKKAKEALDKKYPEYAKSRRAAIAYRDQKAKEGTKRHGTLETYAKLCLENGGKPVGVSAEDYPPEVLDFINWAQDNIERFLFTETYCYSETMWTGGIADLGFLRKDGKRIVGDHKSGKEHYNDQFLQTALYDVMLSENGGLGQNGEKLFDWELADAYMIFPFGSKPFTPGYADAEEYRIGAKEVIHLYKLLAS